MRVGARQCGWQWALGSTLGSTVVLLGCSDDGTNQIGTVDSTAGDDQGTATSAPSTSAGTATGGGTTTGAGTTAASSGDTGNGGGSTGIDMTDTGGPMTFRVVTFNTGSPPGEPHNSDGDDYTQDEADLNDQWYGNGLSWQTNVDATAAWFAALDPDIVHFQEMFYSGDCPMIPASAHPGFVCETWQAGDPTVAQLVMGPDYQIACNLGRNDKCAAVKKSFGSIRGCTGDFCLDGLDGMRVEDCGGGSRIGRGTIDLADGGELTIVNVHGTSGLLPADWACRVAQIDQIFLDLDGEPAANGQRNLIMGDLNVDPYRPILFDTSAARWLNFVDGNNPFQFISEAGPNATPTYTGLVNIDHIISDTFVGTCVAAGIAGEPPVLPTVYYDHVPIICDVTAP